MATPNLTARNLWHMYGSKCTFILLCLFCLSLSSFTAWRGWDMLSRPFPGFAFFDIGRGYAFINAMNQRDWSGMQHGLHFKDVIISVNGKPYREERDIYQPVEHYPVGTPIAYTVLRGEEQLTLKIPTTHFTRQDFFWVFGVCLLPALALIGMAMVVFWLRPERSGSWAFVLFSMGLSIYVSAGVEAGLSHMTTLLFWLSSSLLPATVVQMTVQFPIENQWCMVRRWLIPLVYGVSLGFGLLPLTPWLPNYAGFIGILLLAFLTMSGVAALFFWFSMLNLYRSQDVEQANAVLIKQRAKILLLGALIAFGAPGALSLMSMLFNRYYVPLNYFAPLLLIFPITAAFAIVQYNLFHVDNYLKKILVLFFFMDATLALYYLCSVGLEQWGFSYFQGTPMFTLGFTLLILFLFSPLQQLLTTLVEKLFSRGLQNYQQVIYSLNQQLATLLTRDEILALLSRVFVDELKISHMAIWLKADEETVRCFKHDSGTSCLQLARQLPVEQALLLEPLREPLFLSEVQENPHYSITEQQTYARIFESLGVIVVFPLVFRNALLGIIGLSGKGDLQPYSGEELDMLKTLSYQVAIALENAHFYGTICELNDNLEKKVDDRTQALMLALQEKEQTRAQLVRSESLAAIGQLVAGVAHELNNPLGSAHSLVQSAVEVLEEQEPRTDDTEDILDDLRFVLKEHQRAGEIVRSLLDLSRQTTSYAEPVELNQVVEDAIRVMYNKYKYREVTIERKLGDHLPVIRGNFAQLGQVFMNIIKNAVQVVSEHTGLIVLETRQEGSELVFCCRDNGPGIPEPLLQDIFKPFFTTKTVGEGTGLGLYICHDIIERHHGRIVVRNSAQGGAEFTIYLPLSTASHK